MNWRVDPPSSSSLLPCTSFLHKTLLGMPCFMLLGLEREHHLAGLGARCERRLRVAFLGRDDSPLDDQDVLLRRARVTENLQMWSFERRGNLDLGSALGLEEAVDGLHSVVLVIRSFHLNFSLLWKRRRENLEGASLGDLRDEEVDGIAARRRERRGTRFDVERQIRE